jgi:hypothetical protein
VDAGPPISYLVLAEGTPVRSSDGERVGEVKRVLAVAAKDIFEGLVLETPGGDRFVDADQVASLHERAVILALSAAEARALPEPPENPAAMAVSPDDVAEPPAEHGAKNLVRRVWDWISGRY